MSKSRWGQAIDQMQARIDQTLSALKTEFPHWADSSTGKWTTTADGDWTGGAWPGMLWLLARRSGQTKYLNAARLWSSRLKPRAHLQTAFKGFGFYYGAALGDVLCKDKDAALLALDAATSLKRQFDCRLGLIPLGDDAEESKDVGNSFSSIDSLQAVPLLYWAAAKTSDSSYAGIAARHTTRVLDIHMRPDGSIVQSSELSLATGKVVRHFTHKGLSDSSVWGRAQASALVYTAIALAHHPHEKRWIDRLIAGADTGGLRMCQPAWLHSGTSMIPPSQSQRRTPRRPQSRALRCSSSGNSRRPRRCAPSIVRQGNIQRRP
ncbi:hypothetical protein QA645_40070 [Bradyrhizobium sp. CIAT3101]|uniref:hypothetical protein n=1 Tax=Bradyrhizobium sp. CIAT3101 TaxID=439387 RepID=UPI0024B1233E|nr:hypothetical protein [Bradyrhizobium sp. CIAT3101]WFU80579.1 hypothetical protein QA645_40070 [Bradyrhizobium sp. CIAT3101]